MGWIKVGTGMGWNWVGLGLLGVLCEGGFFVY